jgi:hypothetical protein
MAKPSKFPGKETITVDGVERLVKNPKGIIDSVRELLTKKPGSGNATGTGGDRRRRKIDELVDEAVGQADKDNKRRR